MTSGPAPASLLPVVILGPTAVGKSAIVMRLAGEFARRGLALEVISADSRQVYRGLDIGTAKPTHAERAAVPHHLIDVCDLHDRYDAARFVADCHRVTEDVRGRGAFPLVVGGTGFYVRGLLYGLSEAPSVPAEVREAVQRDLAERGLDALRAELRVVDPESDAAISPNDAYRVTRALEIQRHTGRPRSSFARPQTMRPEWAGRVFVLSRDRQSLYERINRRVTAMIAAGLPGEVERLLARGVSADLPGMQTIGYREWLTVAGSPPWDAAAVDRTAAAIAAATRGYARRQLTFFRGLSPVVAVDADDADALAAHLAPLAGVGRS